MYAVEPESCGTLTSFDVILNFSAAFFFCMRVRVTHKRRGDSIGSGRGRVVATTHPPVHSRATGCTSCRTFSSLTWKPRTSLVSIPLPRICRRGRIAHERCLARCLAQTHERPGKHVDPISSCATALRVAIRERCSLFSSAGTPFATVSARPHRLRLTQGKLPT